MVGLFAQVWFLCLLAFLAGAGVTWLLFVRLARQPTTSAPAPAPAEPERQPEPAAASVFEEPPPPAAPRHQPPEPVAPALADLDIQRDPMHDTGRLPRIDAPEHSTGAAAAGALDDLGVRKRGVFDP